MPVAGGAEAPRPAAPPGGRRIPRVGEVRELRPEHGQILSRHDLRVELRTAGEERRRVAAYLLPELVPD